MSHRQTDLQQSETFELAEIILAWEQGRLSGFTSTVPSNPGVSNWMSVVAAAAGGRPGADADLAAEVDRAEPTVWTSHGRLTLLAHAVATAGSVARAPHAARARRRDRGLGRTGASRCSRTPSPTAGSPDWPRRCWTGWPRSRVSWPTSARSAWVGPVDLARARLADLTGDRATARELLAAAESLSRAAGGVTSVLRCQKLAADWAK